MFEIKFRIVDDIERLSTIDVNTFDRDGADIGGFFALNFGGNIEGYYHDRDLREGEIGHELITTSFSFLLDSILYLEKYNYVAIPMIECYATYLEFVIVDKQIKASLLEYLRKGNNDDFIITTYKTESRYPSWKNIKIQKSTYYQEVIKKTKEYIEIIREINQNLVKTKIFDRLLEKLQVVENLKI